MERAFSLCVSFAVMRYAVSTSVAMVTVYAINTFHWKSATLSWLHVAVGFSSYGVITALVHFKVFRGNVRIYWCYVAGCILACIMLPVLLIPKEIAISNLTGQVAFGACILLVKCLVYFQQQSSGKFLLFNTVTHDNANLVDSFRSVFGNASKILAKGTLFTTSFCIQNILFHLLQ